MTRITATVLCFLSAFALFACEDSGDTIAVTANDAQAETGQADSNAGEAGASTGGSTGNAGHGGSAATSGAAGSGNSAGAGTGGGQATGGSAGHAGSPGTGGSGGAPANCSAVGKGSTCDPTTSSWPTCDLAPVPVRDSVVSSIPIAGGELSTPFVADTPNTEYHLQADIHAAGTAIVIAASNVVINLERHAVTYNESAPGEGVTVGAWNVAHVAVVNGTILQGAAMSEGTESGRGNNPVSTYDGSSGLDYETSDFQVANLYVRYGGRDVSGISVSGAHALIEQTTVEDTFEFGTLKNRHQGIDAIGTAGSQRTVRNNTIANARQRGIQVGSDSIVSGNLITIRSIATNSYGVFGWEQSGVSVFDNTIIARGEHPIGIAFASTGTDNIDIYNNCIDTQTTGIGEEYASSPSCFEPSTPCGNYAVGFRTTWGGNNIRFHHNVIHIATDAAYQGRYSIDGSPVVVDAKGRGLMVGLPEGDSSLFSNNQIEVVDKDGSGKAFGVACVNNFSDGLFIVGNTIRSNVANLVLGDEYGECGGQPLMACNTLVKVDQFVSYQAVSSQLGGYFNASGRLLGTNYQGGASADSVELNASGDGTVSVYFGNLSGGSFTFDYRLHDDNGSSATILREDFVPPIELPYAIPAGLNACNP